MFALAAPNIDVNGIPFQEAFHNDGKILGAAFEGIIEPKFFFFMHHI